MTTEKTIATDLLEYLRENTGACAGGNVHGWRWVRSHDVEWQGVRYSSAEDRRHEYVEGAVLDEDYVLEWLVEKPIQIIPQSEAYSWSPADTTVWEDAADQDVFDDADRCHWCVTSEHDTDLTAYRTTEDGGCLLCPDCHESWLLLSFTPTSDAPRGDR